MPRERFMRVSEVLETIGFRKSWLYREVNAGRFPSPIYVGRIPLWRESIIDAWVAAQVPEKE